MRIRRARGRFAATVLAAATIGGTTLIGAAATAPPAAAAPTVTALPTGFGGMAVDAGTNRVFVSSPGAGTVTALDFAGHIVGSATGLAGPGSMVVDGTTLYVVLQNAGAIAELDTTSLTPTGTLGSGSLVQPGPLALAGGLLWTSSGACGQWSTQLVSVNPVTGVVAAYTMPTSSHLPYCIGLAAAPQLPGTLLAWDTGEEPPTFNRIDLSTGVPVVTSSVWEQNEGFVQQLAINPDGGSFVAAAGSPYSFYEFNSATLAADGIVYPANPYPTAVVTSAARGGLVVGGINGIYDPDVVAYHTGQPGTNLLTYDFGGSSNTVVDAGMALSPDGSTLFAVTGTSGSSGSTSFNVLPLANDTATSVSASSPNTPGSAVTLTAAVRVASGGFPAPTGTVTFAVDGSTVGSAALGSDGQATVQVAGLASGGHTATASYGGDPDNAASTSAPYAFQVGVATTTTLASSANPSTAGQPVTFTATVAGGTNESGSVTFTDGAGGPSAPQPLATVPLGGDGTASFTTSSLAAGSHDITASYGGDGTNLASSAKLTQTVNGYPTTTSVASSPDPSYVGQSVTFTATVTGDPSSSATPTGTVNFYQGQTWLGSGSVAGGSASITTGDLSEGSWAVTAVYGGDGTNAGSSGVTTQVVNRYASSTSLTTSQNPSTAGQPVTFTVTVTGSAPYGPSGTVTLYDGSNAIGSAGLAQAGAGTPPAQQATFTVSALSVGQHSISATYNGDAYNAPSSSGALAQSVSQASSTTTVSSGANAAVVGQQTTLTATVSGDAPSGRVVFSEGSTDLGSATVGTDGRASVGVTFTTAGTHQIVATYGGDANNTGSSGSLSLTVNPAPSSMSVTSSGAAQVGQTVAFTATVTGYQPGGSVTFSDGSRSLGSAPVVNGAATLQWTAVGAGSHTITAAYSGDANNTASSAAVPQTVNPDGSTTAVSASANPVKHHSPVTFTATVTANPAGANPAGTVTFYANGKALATVNLGSGSNGTATATYTTSFNTGSYTITATYASTTPDVTGSTSTGYTETVK